MKRALTVAFCLTGLFLLPFSSAYAYQDGPLSARGDYAGTFLCSLGEMGMSLQIDDLSQEDLEAQFPCKTGAGRCNTARLTRTISGVLNFYPTVSNPDSPKGAFRVSGDIKYITDEISRLNLEPTDWIDQPEKFGASALTATLRKGVIIGKPSAPGCHTLRMHKISQ